MTDDSDNYDKVRTIFDPKTRELLIFDIFMRDSRLYILTSAYTDMDVVVNNSYSPIAIDEIIMHTELEPFCLIVYKKLDDSFSKRHKINVEIKNRETREFMIPNQLSDNKFTLVHSTLLKDDYVHFERFHKYYKTQGIQKFFIYYNGRISSNVAEYFETFPEVQLIEWNYPYRVNDYMHFAQPAQIHHFLYKYAKGTSRWICICDMDEYLKNTSNLTLLDTIKKTPEIDCFYFQNYWAEKLSETNGIPDEIMVCPQATPFPLRTKMIVKTSSIKSLYIHWIREPTDLLSVTSRDWKMFHFYNLVQTQRRRTDCCLKEIF